MRLAVVTHRLARRWMQAARPWPAGPPGLPSFVVDTAAPFVALVGVTSPRLFAARAVVESCTAEELAALLLKVARLSGRTVRGAAAVSPFVDDDGLARRVRRLLAEDAGPAPQVTRAMVPVAGLGIVLTLLAGWSSPAALRAVHEAVVAFCW